VVNVARERLARYTDDRARSFDRKHGTDTFTRIQMKELGLKDDLGGTFSNWAYGPICPEFFHEIVREISNREELVFLDVGSGKGLPLMLAGDYGFRRVVGIELSEELNVVARKNFSAYTASTGKPVNAEIICGDFMKHELPNEPTAFFLNNPFPDYIATHAVTHIENSIAKHPRRVVIAYRHMQEPILRQLEASPNLRLELTTPYWQIFTTR
jgi:16S rRNA A1518/A1519 N6-dimethyltransferase RsmA/KsgA/DIM1 with predicted DNA glycosylase/AP lyase activity